MDNRYSINDLIQQDVENILMHLYTSIPAIVTKYDATSQKVDVRVAVETPTYYGDNIAPSEYFGIPVIFPSGSDWVIGGPLVAGDSVILVAPHYGTEEYLAGNKDKTGKPVNVSRHTLNDAVAVPGMFTNKKTIKDSVKDRFQISQGDNLITFDDNDGIVITNPNNSIKIIPDDNIEIETEGGSKITLNPNGETTIDANVTINGNLTVTGTTDTSGLIANGVDHTSHTHPYTDNGSPMTTGGPQ